MKSELVKISRLKNNSGQVEGLPANPRLIKDNKYQLLKNSIQEDPDMMELREVIAYDNGDELVVIAGNMRLRACKELGYKEVPTKILPADTDVEKLKRITIKDNAGFGEHDWDILGNLWSDEPLADWGMDLPEDWLEQDNGTDDGEKNKLSDVFIAPPFSVLDTKQGYWQGRKREWLGLGIASELGREDIGSISNDAQKGLNSLAGTDYTGGTSVFDPVLCEIAYSWFNVSGGSVLDPFAGGSVRGIIANKLGQKYTGHELRKEQVEANIMQSRVICSGEQPVWVAGDSNKTLDSNNGEFDLLFSCPPYADLEVYSDDPDDLSNMPYDKFIEIYRSIIAKSCSKLKNDRFAVWVIGEVRDKKGVYYNFVGDTVKAFTDAGLNYYNEMILVNTAGTLPLRAGRQFNAGRKVGKQHQNVLVFYKGNPKNIKSEFGALDFSGIEEMFDSEE